MSGIVLSSSVRQNLLSLQSTADLLPTTQSRLQTGKSVNSALDNPTNFFTAQSLDNQALQTTVGYSSKSNVSTTISGATASDLRGTTSFTSASALSSVLY